MKFFEILDYYWLKFILWWQRATYSHDREYAIEYTA